MPYYSVKCFPLVLHRKAQLLWVPTRHQLADALTKGGRSKDLRELIKCGMTFREEAVKRKSSQKYSVISVKVVVLLDLTC